MSQTNDTMQEQGAPLPSTDAVPGLPPNAGLWPVQPYLMFASQVRAGGQRTFTSTFDEALKNGGITNASRMENDPVISEAINSRAISVSQMDWVFKADEVNNPEEVAFAKAVKWALDDFDDFNEMRWWLGWDCYFGKNAAMLAYGRDNGPSRFTWVEELFDYDNELGVSAGSIYGMKKTVFNSADFSDVVMSTYAVSH
jgi:hypothetical protein